MGERRISFKGNLVFLIILCVSVCGCHCPTAVKTFDEMVAEPVPPLTIQAGDVVDVTFFYVPELDTSQTVLPDGTMSLQLLGLTSVQGKTPKELQDELTNRYSAHLKEPLVSVTVRRVEDSKVYVGGEVYRPGLVQMAGKLSVLDAVMEAGGGIRPTADLCNVLVVRQREDRHYSCLVNLKATLSGEEGRNFMLQPRDVVYVPPTMITKADDWVSQYINRIIPETRTIFTYPVGEGTIGIDTSNPTY
jgi:polysaccharide biosynthesis/export protein